MTLATMSMWPWLSSSLAAVIQMDGSVGTAWRALFNTWGRGVRVCVGVQVWVC